MARHRWRAVVYGLVGVYIVSVLVNVDVRTWDWQQFIAFTVLYQIVTPLALVWFVDLFSRGLYDDGQRPDAVDAAPRQGPVQSLAQSPAFHRLKQQWMVFAYGFMVFAIVAAVLPFTLAPKATLADAQAPISIVRGCVEGTGDDLAMLRCGADPIAAGYTWLIQIGGKVTAVADSGTDSGTGPVAGGGAASSEGPAPAPIGAPETFVVSGGLVLPLYLVIVALSGGAISLTRRIPEYQKQAEPDYRPEPGKPHLTPELLREYLVFQIVQFVSAPFLAIIAFYLILPDSTAAVVVLAFGAGFASETVLLWVRAVVEKLAPLPIASGATGTVVTLVSDADGVPVAGMRVGIVAQAVAGITDHRGACVLDGVASGPQALALRDGGDDVATLPRHLCLVVVGAGQTVFERIELSADRATADDQSEPRPAPGDRVAAAERAGDVATPPGARTPQG